MAKDFTDYVAEVHGAGHRVYFQHHFRQLRKDPEVTEFEVNGRTYSLDKDRAYLTRGYRPWRKWNLKRPFWTIKELTRSKKVGLLKYREPEHDDGRLVPVEKEVPALFTCTICAERDKKVWVTHSERAAKAHITRFHEGAKFEKIMDIETKIITIGEIVYDPIEPMHLSRMHQPSGITLKDDKMVGPDGTPITLEPDSLLHIVTTKVLKIEVEDPSYVKQYKSYKFGKPMALAQRWYLWLALAIAGIFIVLIATGNFE